MLRQQRINRFRAAGEGRLFCRQQSRSDRRFVRVARASVAITPIRLTSTRSRPTRNRSLEDYSRRAPRAVLVIVARGRSSHVVLHASTVTPRRASWHKASAARQRNDGWRRHRPPATRPGPRSCRISGRYRLPVNNNLAQFPAQRFRPSNPNSFRRCSTNAGTLGRSFRQWPQPGLLENRLSRAELRCSLIVFRFFISERRATTQQAHGQRDQRNASSFKHWTTHVLRTRGCKLMNRVV